MISATFIDRPRLAIVISIVITLAGLIALKALPVAQFPDIVPPVVEVKGSYPGAGAEVVEQSVAQPIESQVVGVDNIPESSLFWPPLTSMRQRLREAGAQAVQMVDALIAQSDDKIQPTTPTTTLLQPELIGRGSTRTVQTTPA